MAAKKGRCLKKSLNSECVKPSAKKHTNDIYLFGLGLAFENSTVTLPYETEHRNQFKAKSQMSAHWGHGRKIQYSQKIRPVDSVDVYLHLF
jgi:hypothetical protein